LACQPGHSRRRQIRRQQFDDQSQSVVPHCVSLKTAWHADGHRTNDTLTTFMDAQVLKTDEVRPAVSEENIPFRRRSDSAL